ncbi:MAG TPA: FtsX-like permease family protein [Ktedonobacterales bacterium]|nr:FtsX-like permease family protein [Ktedonobacterales bacterium]
MWSYVWRMLQRQPGKSTLASGGFALIACALVLLSATTQTAVVQGNQIISQSWRPTYDLVVLPPNVKLPPGQTVPPDFLEGYGGGISMQQYEAIKSLPGVQVAAPIAYIGYMSLPTPRISFPNRDFAPGFYQVNWTLTAFNGQKQLIEYQESAIYYIFPCVVGYNALPLDIILQNPEIQTPAYQESTCPAAASPTGQPPILDLFTPNIGGFLLAAIDPTAENQLVHLDQSVTDGRMLTEQDTLHDDARLAGEHFCNQDDAIQHCDRIPAEAMPMLIHQNLPGQIGLTTQFTQLALGSLSDDQLSELSNPAYVAQLPDQQSIYSGPVPLVQSNPDRFANADLAWDGQSWQPQPLDLNKEENAIASYTLDLYDPTKPASLLYRPTTAPDGSAGYRLVPTGTEGPEVTFRPLMPLKMLKKQFVDGVYTYEEIGQFSDASIAAQFANPLNWLPENTYTAPPVVLRYDAQGQPVTPTMMLPTTNKAGYLLQPPLALTTLAAAQQLVGDKLISAIRVRVAGVSQANQNSWQQIQRVANLIHLRTGLPVVITLGSSPSPTLVYVPGAKAGQFGQNPAIDPTGWVEERWISIGASVLYLAQLGATRLLVLLAVLVVSLGYLVVSLSALLSAQRKEFALLSALGWPPWLHARLFLMQALLFALVGGLVGMGAALLIATMLDAIPIWLIVIWTLPAMLLVALLGSLYPLWTIWRIQPAEILRAGAAIAAPRIKLLRVPLWAIGGLALRNLARSRPRTVMTVGSLFLSALLLVLMMSSILALRQTLLGTLLGSYVLVQTAALQIAGCVFALLLSFLSVADLLLLQVRERQQEIGVLQAVGWRPRLIQGLFAREGVLLALLGAVPGALVAEGILAAQHQMQNAVAPLIGVGAVLVLALVAGLAALPALRAVSRMQVMDVLRGE